MNTTNVTPTGPVTIERLRREIAADRSVTITWSLAGSMLVALTVAQLALLSVPWRSSRRRDRSAWSLVDGDLPGATAMLGATVLLFLAAAAIAYGIVEMRPRVLWAVSALFVGRVVLIGVGSAALNDGTSLGTESAVGNSVFLAVLSAAAAGAAAQFGRHPRRTMIFG
ncbi:MAG: hypothetical protein AAFP84_07030 [Actinomycetota bacterium]